MLKSETINLLLGITESYQAPQRMLEVMLDDIERPKLFDAFLEHETDLSYEWFQSYFEDEHSDRKNKKQDFTPGSVSKLLAKLTGEANSYFEAAAGTGGIMIQFWNKNKGENHWYQVEELSERSTPFLIFNMAIRGMNGVVLRGDSLAGEFEAIYRITDNGKYSTVLPFNGTLMTDKHGAVLMNPPFSAKWSADKRFLEDERYSSYKVLAPKSKADYAFLLHGFDKLKDGGTMAIVLPHGVLFRGNAEGKIRKALLENGAIDAVIGLPGNLFHNTDIPTTVLVLKKNRSEKDVMFIDASKEFEKVRTRNLLKDEHLDNIFKAYIERNPVDKFAHLASYEEIQENDFNLNIPRFVDTFEEPEPIDLLAVAKESMELDSEIAKVEASILEMLNELVSADKETEKTLEATKAMFSNRSICSECGKKMNLKM